MVRAQVTVRSLRPTDAVAYQCLASDFAIATMRGSPCPLPPGEGERQVRRAMADRRAGQRFPFVVAENDEARGFANLFLLRGEDGKHAPEWHFSYWIGRPYWNRGLGKILVRACVSFGFSDLNLDILHAEVYRSNWPSRRVLRSVGFVDALPEETYSPKPAEPVPCKILRMDRLKSEVMMDLQTLLDGYTRIYNIPPIHLNENGMCRLRFRDAVDIDIEPARRPDHIHLYTTLARAPRDPGSDLYKRMMAANLFGNQTGYASVAYNPKSHEFILCQLVSMDRLTAEIFDVMIQDLVEATEKLRAEILQGDVPAREAQDKDELQFSDTANMIRI